LAEELLSFDRPIWFAKHLTREERQISRPRGDDFVGLRRFGDQSHRSSENVRLFANRRAQRHLSRQGVKLLAPGCGNVSLTNIATTRG
jgi:hypothetical protein